MYVRLYSKVPPARRVPYARTQGRTREGGPRRGALTNTFSERTVAVPPPQGPGEDAFSVHLGRFVPEGL